MLEIFGALGRVGNECANYAVCLFNSEPQGEPRKDRTCNKQMGIHLEYTGEEKKQGRIEATQDYKSPDSDVRSGLVMNKSGLRASP